MHETKVELKIPELTLVQIAQLARYETVNTRSEHYNPKAKGSSPVRGSFFAEFILLLCNSGIDASMIYFKETSNEVY